jgi:hypothetical protein
MTMKLSCLHRITETENINLKIKQKTKQMHIILKRKQVQKIYLSETIGPLMSDLHQNLAKWKKMSPLSETVGRTRARMTPSQQSVQKID